MEVEEETEAPPVKKPASRMRRPASATATVKAAAKPKAKSKAKAKAKAASSKRKADPVPSDAPKDDNKTDNADTGEEPKKRRRGSKPNKDQEDNKKEVKEDNKTWAGRWIPTDDAARNRMMAMKHVFDTEIGKRLTRPSSFQKPWFKVCSAAFVPLADKHDPSWDDYVAAAKTCVEGFLKDTNVRT